MLVLTRREGEQIRIGANVLLTVERVSGDKVRLSFRAPPVVEIWRQELLDAKESDVELSDAA